MGSDGASWTVFLSRKKVLKDYRWLGSSQQGPKLVIISGHRVFVLSYVVQIL